MPFISGSGSGSNRGQGSVFVRHIDRFIGKTVTIFTTSGGASGCGFTGVILSVNRCFVRLVTDFGAAPANPLAENISGSTEIIDPNGRGCSGTRGHGRSRAVGSVVDIPVDRIAAFCHNAI